MPTIIESGQKARERNWIEIRLDRLLLNLEAIKQRTGPSEIMAVVKANAYGHGLASIAQTLSGKITYFGVASAQEVINLKELGLPTPIFLFGRLLNSEIPSILMNGVTCTISSYEEARELSEISEKHFRRTPVHIKVDTGMGRLGISFRDAFTEIEKIVALPGLIAEGLYTHFPNAEVRDGFCEKQLEDFDLLIRVLEQKKIRFKFLHAANSAGSVRFKHPRMNMNRPGLMLYGLYPDEGLRISIELKPILALKTRAVLIKELKGGESAGYGRQFVADHPTRIAILPIGYSHGYPVQASGRAECLIHGKRFKIAGRISMDSMAVHIDQEPLNIGEEVTLLGENEAQTIRAEDIAVWSGTIPYEIVTRLSYQLPRFYQS